MIDQEFQKVAQAVELYLVEESSGHDFYHAERVYNNAMYLQQKEGGDRFVIGVAALVHDICRPWEKKTGKLHFGPEALEIIGEVLVKAEVDKQKIEEVLAIVEFHDVYDWSEKMANKSLELMIVQDADNLDATGALGVARTFAFGGANGLSLYNPGEKLAFDQDYVEKTTDRTSSVAHFYEKLLKLKENMNTATGKKLAEERNQFMVDFLDQFFKEWEGKF